MNEIFKKKHREKTPKHTLKVIHVERIWQREEGVGHPKSACGPAAAAMVVKYLSRKGFVTFDSMENTELVNVLYRKIGTFPWGKIGRASCRERAERSRIADAID